MFWDFEAYTLCRQSLECPIVNALHDDNNNTNNAKTHKTHILIQLNTIGLRASPIAYHTQRRGCSC